MKLIPFLTFVTAFAALLPAHAGIDFSPTTSERVLSGFKFQQLNFTHGSRKISYEQPAGWSYSGGGAGIKFLPPDVTQAQSTIEQSPASGPQPLDEETRARLQQQTLASVPPDSRGAALVSELHNPLLVNNNETYEVTVSYEAFGQQFMMSVLYLNLPDTQVRFRTVARSEDFEKLHTAFRGSIFSWQWK